MNAKQIDVMADEIVRVLKQAIDPLKARNAELEQRIKTLEATPFVKFCGTFAGGKSYAPGDAVVHQSALWVCKVATQGTPSKDFVGWQLALKKGDAR